MKYNANGLNGSDTVNKSLNYLPNAGKSDESFEILIVIPLHRKYAQG